MKKGLAILAALAMVIMVAACGADAIPTKAPTDKPAESTAEVKPAESTPAATQPAETKPAETKPAETQAPETKPAETQAPETKPVETTPAATQPPETKPVETTPAATQPPETKPVETQPVAGKDEYYKTYLGSEDMKTLSQNIRMAMLLNGEEAYAMTYASDALIMEAAGGKIELYRDGGKLYAHVYVKPADGGEGEDNWYSCEIPEGEDPFESFGGPENIFEDVDGEDMDVTYLDSFIEDGVEYDRILMKDASGTSDPDSPQEAVLTVKADTHEIVRMEMEMADPEDPENVQGMVMDFLPDDAIAMPAGIEAEESDYQTVLMTVFLGMMSLMGDFM